jgi:23S rRNA (pseudouridine1915-N3)-methyltransferase
MKLRLLYLRGQSAAWVETGAADFAKKISGVVPFVEESIRSPSVERERAEEKTKAEGEALLKNIEKNERLILFDEKGREFKDSRQFSTYLVKGLSAGRLTFAIGGPYGFSSAVRERADGEIRLATLTMNHHIARLAALEQIYRGLAIWKNLPYHNE